MLRNGLLTDRRSSRRPLVGLSVAALLAASTPVRAESPSANEAQAARRATMDVGQAARPVLALGSLPLAGATSAAGAAAAPASPPSGPAPAASPPSDDGAALRTIGYVAGGIGIVGFVLFAVAGIGAKNAHDRLDEACNAGRCNDASTQADIEDGKRLQTAANVGLVTGLAGVGLGATLIVLGAHSAHDASAVGAARPGGMITLAGRF
jgi:hypothetical protein